MPKSTNHHPATPKPTHRPTGPPATQSRRAQPTGLSAHRPPGPPNPAHQPPTHQPSGHRIHAEPRPPTHRPPGPQAIRPAEPNPPTIRPPNSRRTVGGQREIPRADMTEHQMSRSQEVTNLDPRDRPVSPPRYAKPDPGGNPGSTRTTRFGGKPTRTAAASHAARSGSGAAELTAPTARAGTVSPERRAAFRGSWFGHYGERRRVRREGPKLSAGVEGVVRRKGNRTVRSHRTQTTDPQATRPPGHPAT